MATAEAIARYFLHLASQAEEPTPITHMQLQKLLYYVQGWSLAMRGEPAFEERIEAWSHGPVVPPLYGRFKTYGRDVIDDAGSAEGLDEATCDLVDSIWERYSRYSAKRLRDMTHGEPPWQQARGDLPDDASSKAEITRESLEQFFRAEQDRYLRKIGIDPDRLRESREQARRGELLPLSSVLDR